MGENTHTLQPNGACGRNYGVDLLRIVSMFYIVMLHTLGMGGVTGAAAKDSLQYLLGTFWEMSLYCALNIFALISGYVGYREQERAYKYGSYLELWLQVVFTGVAVAAVFRLLDPGAVSAKDFLRALLPVTSNTYWYFTAYTALFFLVPLIDAGVRACGKEQLYKLFAVLAAMFSVYSTVMDRWYLHDGFSFLWLAALYFMGAVMKKYSWEKRVSPAFSLGGIALCALLSCGLKLLEQRWPLLDRSLVSSTYLTPTHVCSAVLYLLLFAGMTVPKWLRKVTAFAAPGAFAVYLLNCNSFIWDRFVVNRFGFLAERTLGEMVLTVLGTSAAFVLVSVTADALRQKLFRLLGVKKHAQNVTDGCYRWILRFVDLCKKSKMFHRE